MPLQRKSPLVFAGIVLLGLSSCAVRQTHDRDYVSREIEARSGHPLAAPSKAGALRIPPGIDPAKLAEEDAVAVALWNNPAFQSDLATLGFARADLLEAGLLKNPLLTLLFPLGPKQLEFTLTFPAEVLWQRPRRVEMAKLNAEAVAHGLVQNGLVLAGAVRAAHANLWLAQSRADVVKRMAGLDAEISQITDARWRAGDVSEFEAIALRARALRTQEEALRADSDVAVARAQLGNLLGVGNTEIQVSAVSSPLPAAGLPETRQLLRDAFAARPDLRAAELQMEAAGKRIGWEKSKVFQLSLLLDANGQGREGFEAGPGIALPLPFFDWNQVGITRAQTEMERAALRYAEVQQRIVLEVREAQARAVQARDALQAWQAKVIPAVRERALLAERAFLAGDVSYLSQIEVSRELMDAELHQADLEAELRRAVGRLEQAVGKKVK